MAPFRRLMLRVVSLFRAGRAEADLAREIDSHLRLLEEQFRAQGMSERAARYAARRAFGGVEQAKEHHRDERSFRWLAGWPMDLKLGVRMLGKSPGLTIVAVVALAVAIGAGAAYLEFTRDLMYPTLPVAGADRIVGIKVWDTERRAYEPRALRDFAVWRQHPRAIEKLGAAVWFERHVITADGRTDPARGSEISASAFSLIPARPVLGRMLTEDDEAPGAPPVVLLGSELWKTRFGSDPNVVGRVVHLGSVAHTIVGVMPDGFAFPVNDRLWTPLRVPAAGVKRGQGPRLLMFGRLREGVSAEAAQAELQGQLADAPPVPRVDVRLYLDSYLSGDRGGLEAVILNGANLVFVMLLALCGANVATLVFARTAMREGEITVRTALGASRGRISAQLFAEALVLSSAGAIAGLMVARFVGLWAKQTWVEASGQPRPFWWNDSLSPETILYAVALAVLAAALVGLIPAAKATGARLQSRLREAGAAGSSMKFGRMWTGVIVMQAAITVIVLSLVVSLGWAAVRGDRDLDVTYNRAQFLTARVSVTSQPGVVDAGSLSSDTMQAILERVRREPGVVSATYASAVPGTTWDQFVIEFPESERDLAAEANARKFTDVLWSDAARVGVNFFETFGIPLVAGRYFTNAEVLGGHHVAIVDETWVRTILGGRRALGVMVRQPAGDGRATPGPWHEIVGVVKDVTHMPRKGPDDAVLYRPAEKTMDRTLLIVRTQEAAAPMAHQLQAAALSPNPDLRLGDTMPLDRLAADEALPVHFFLRIVAVIGAIALLLATAGIYSLISFTLARRTREIGIRAALGAAPARIISGVFSRAFMQVGIGVLAGAVPSFVIIADGVDDGAGMKAIAAAGVTLAVCAFVVLVALTSCAPPLRRALRIEPTQALRAE